jgi:SPX domain
VTLTAETAFYQLLWTTSQALAAHLLTLFDEYRNRLESLSDDITQAAKPRSSTSSFRPLSFTSDPANIPVRHFKEKESDLYAWREIFQLYVELSPFDCQYEINRGERSIEEAEILLKSFAEKINQAGLNRKPKMKLKQSQEALERFMELTRFILTIKEVRRGQLRFPFLDHSQVYQFQLLNVEATRKILKKHAKHIPLPLPYLSMLDVKPFDHTRQTAPLSSYFAEFSLVPNSASSLTRIMVQAINETLLTVIPRLDDYACLICTSIAFKPIRLGCGHLFCVRCVVRLSMLVYIPIDHIPSQMSCENAEKSSRKMSHVSGPDSFGS